MKTRILHTEFWKKMARYKAPKEARYLYSYLLTNMYINMCGVFELPDEYMLLETALNEKELEKAKSWLTEHKKVYFHDGWVKVANAEEYNNYKNGEKNSIAYDREIKDIPSDVLSNFEYLSDSSIDTSMDSSINRGMDTPPKSVIINKKSEKGVVKGEDLVPIEEFIAAFNKFFARDYHATDDRRRSLKARLKRYTLEQIIKATESLSKSKFHRGENDRSWCANPDFILRNDGQIDTWLNYTSDKKQEDPSINEYGHKILNYAEA